jgi:hypothetical protein
MRSLLPVAAAVALFAAAGACGSSITVPDQGVVVNGCRTPSFCYTLTCDCLRASTAGPPNNTQPGGICVIPTVCSDGTNANTTDDPSSCFCPAETPSVDGGVPGGQLVQCLEVTQLCVGRGPYCAGPGAFCLQAGQSCDGAEGDPPQLVPASGEVGLEPHCQFTDDVCCGGQLDAGVPETD